MIDSKFPSQNQGSRQGNGDTFQQMRSRARSGALGGPSVAGTATAGMDAAGKKPPVVDTMNDQRPVAMPYPPPYPQGGSPNAGR